MQDRILEHWQITKPSKFSDAGMVSSQHHLATDVGIEILEQGGNAIDAAVAAGLAIGVVEPWMSGIGGGGYTLIYIAKTGTTHLVEYGMRAPFASTPEDYPLLGSGENSADSFNWPAVVGDTNIHGPLAAAVPGYIKGVSLALQHFGTMDWARVIEPACKLAEWGLPIDWFSSQKINHFSRGLATYAETKRVYLADGLPPVPNLDGSIDTITLGNLASTYRRLQQKGAEDYYSGELAKEIASDLAAVGSRITLQDLTNYEAKLSEPLSGEYRGARVHTAGPLTAGPSLLLALELLEPRLDFAPEVPDAQTYQALAESLQQAYEYRLSKLGEGDKTPGNTTHICVADKEGNVVSHTQTIMSAFGSRIMLPNSGILMNNGMMWFDPTPGGPNSVVGGRHPLCNMCPTMVEDEGNVLALGACGGRKIFPAVFQLISFLLDFDMTIGEAAHQPRLDVSGTDLVMLMDSLPEDMIRHMTSTFTNTQLRPNGVSPNFFALPQLLKRGPGNILEGACFIPSPHAKVGVI